MKKLVTLLCALVLCLSVFNVASACGKYPDDYNAFATGNDIVRNVGNGHQKAIEFAEVCSICGKVGGYTYEYVGGIYSHWSNGQRHNYHSGRQHYFYSVCTVCYAQYNTKSGLCPGSDTKPHITEASAHFLEACIKFGFILGYLKVQLSGIPILIHSAIT